MSADKKATDPTAASKPFPPRTATEVDPGADPARSSDPMIANLLARIDALELDALVSKEAAKKAEAFQELARASITELSNGMSTLAKQHDHMSVYLESQPPQEGTTDVYRRHMIAGQSAVRELMGG